MTTPRTRPRKLSRGAWALAGVILLAAGLRLHGVGFGLPALLDPDEPLFMMLAFDMLRHQTLNPHWFGHPATTTLYGLALTILGVMAAGLATGHFADAAGFARAIYADPGIVFLPARLTIVASGVLCVWLTARLGRRIAGRGAGLAAATFLAVNAVHIVYSQIIRTDVQAGVFMLLATLCAVAILRRGTARDYVLAGVCVGLACATKWPAAIVVLNPVCAGLYRLWQGEKALPKLALFAGASALALFAASPYLLLDYPTVLTNLAGEARPAHPGGTGSGFLGNFAWYAAGPLRLSLGWAGMLLAMAGLVWGLWRNRAFAVAVAPAFLAFLIVISAQKLVWQRWVVPLLPFLAICMAMAIAAGLRACRRRWRWSSRLALPLAVLALAAPMLLAARDRATERDHDSRVIASAWVRANVPAGSTILVEHGAVDLLHGPWRLLFPLGSAGCVDAKAALAGQIGSSRVESLRAGSPTIDFAHVTASEMASCRADYAILTHYQGYLDAPGTFARELEPYRALLARGTPVLVVRPEAGRVGGPTVYVVRANAR